MRCIKNIAVILFIFMITVSSRASSVPLNHISFDLINKPAPAFYLPDLLNKHKTFSQQELLGHVSLLHVWASWCGICRNEFPFLMSIASSKEFKLYGLNYRDDPEAAKTVLLLYGNPYLQIGVDATGSTSTDLGVYGTPETFILDKKGVIRYKQMGEMTKAKWDYVLKPIIDSLQRE